MLGLACFHSLALANQTEQLPVNHLKALLQPINGMTAKFNQKVIDNDGVLLQQFSGEVALQKPQLFRWEVKKPEPNLVVSDGKKLWNYDELLEQVTVQKIDVDGRESPIGFLLTGNLERLETDFEVIRIAEDTKKCFDTMEWCFSLTPKVQNNNYQRLEMGFSQGEIRILRMLDQLGQTSEFKFDKVVTNPNLAKEQFQFKPPADVDVIGEI